MALSGFDEAEVERLLAGANGALPEPEPKVSGTRTKFGEIWQLGEHRLLVGDSTDGAQLVEVMQGKLAHLVYTDPPYGVDYTGGTKKREALSGDQRGTGIYVECLPLIAEVAEPKAALYLWHGGALSLDVATALDESGFAIRAQLIWVKNLAQFGALSAQYKQQHEPCFYAHHKGKAPHWYGPKNEVTVWEADRAVANDYHPTQKPVALAERALRNSSRRGDLVLDAFGGSGATLIAAERLERRCRMVELDPVYCDVILARWETETGKKAKRA